MSKREWIKTAPADLREGDETPDYTVTGDPLKGHEDGPLVVVSVRYKDGGNAARSWPWDKRNDLLVQVSTDVGQLVSEAEAAALERLARLPEVRRVDAVEALAESLATRVRDARRHLGYVK